MSDIYQSIMGGLSEALDDAKSNGGKLSRKTVVVAPIKSYNADSVKRIRKTTGMSQKLFAGYLGVSVKTVEAWESGLNTPSGVASRLLSMIEMDSGLIDKFPFVITKEKTGIRVRNGGQS